MGARYISLKPLAFNECVQRESYEGLRKTKRRFHNNCLQYKLQAISSLGRVPTVCLYQAAKPLGNIKHFTVLSYTCIHFLFILLALFFQFIDLGVNLETSICSSKLWYVGNITFLAAQTWLWFCLLNHFCGWLGFLFSLYCIHVSTLTINVLCCMFWQDCVSEGKLREGLQLGEMGKRQQGKQG